MVLENQDGQAPVDTAPAPDTSQTEAPVQAFDGDEDIESILRYDPFSEPETQPLPEPEPTSVVEAQPTQTPVDPEPASAPGLTLEAIAGQMNELKGLLTARQVPASAEDPAPAAEQDPLPDYNFTFPDQLITMMASGDPEQIRQAMTAYTTGIARVIHGQIRDAYRAEMSERVPTMLQETTQHRQQQEALFNDFYSEYQDLNYPVLRPVVIDATNRILRQYPQIAQLNAEQFRAVWPKLKSAIGTTARGLVSQIRGAGSPAPQTVATSQATVPGGGGGGASPPRLPVTQDIHDEVNSWR